MVASAFIEEVELAWWMRFDYLHLRWEKLHLQYSVEPNAYKAALVGVVKTLLI